ncbi:hypothetical protein [Pseudomonas sp.]|uniref:hypothetical protein n=1 Tax=Pseudomonas sp. TaxID=306 RepID=UPI0032422C0E|tara:strand:- start:202 stop:693 length:492 start_codon:yes stop_codon:yes gene_type:complete
MRAKVLARIYPDLLDFVQRRFAGLRAAFAGLGADPAVLVLLGVTLAFVAAPAARIIAGLDHCSKNLNIRSGAPGRHRSGCRTNVGAIEIQPDALPELRNHIFRQARVSAGRAGLCAAICFFDELDEPVGCAALNMRMGADHFADVHVISFRLGFGSVEHTGGG